MKTREQAFPTDRSRQSSGPSRGLHPFFRRVQRVLECAMTDAKLRPIFNHPEKTRNRDWPVYTLEEVGRHANKDDCWIVVSDKVFDMTKHVQTHEGWIGSGKVSTLVALLSAMGTDCTDDVLDSHDGQYAPRRLEPNRLLPRL